jgi:hypothetical protein
LHQIVKDNQDWRAHGITKAIHRVATWNWGLDNKQLGFCLESVGFAGMFRDDE